jgi:hydrogenase nickel incorporation protein HypA/HybF
MHEASVARNIILALEERMAGGGIDGRVRVVFLRLGRLTTIVPDNLKFMFEVLAEDTPFADARLEVEMVPVTGECRSCDAGFEIDEACFLCPVCRSPQVELKSGREMCIEAVEAE